LVGAEIELATMEGRERRLKSELSEEAQKYNFVLIDTPPSLGLLTLNALVAAETMTGRDGNTMHAIPHQRLQDILRKYNRLEG